MQKENKMILLRILKYIGVWLGVVFSIAVAVEEGVKAALKSFFKDKE